MTKAELVSKISEQTGVKGITVQAVVESCMEEVKEALIMGEPVYLRGFGSFIIKERKAKTARNIKEQTTMVIPEHKIPAFKPSKSFVNKVKNNL